MNDEIKNFVSELSGFADTAENTLKKIEENMEANKSLFSVFSEKMFTIRGTAQQLNLPEIALIAGLGEEIAIKGMNAEKRPQIRKCIGSLWDAITTVKHLLIQNDKDTGEEQQILINRLEYTLKAFGGARPTFSDDEIQALLAKNQGS